MILHSSRFKPSMSSLSAALLSSSLLIACNSSETGGGQSQTALPRNASPSSSITEAAQESGLTPLEICGMIVTNLTSFFSTERGVNATCNLSAFSGSFQVPGSAEICDSINSGCRSNYTVQGSCTPEVVSQISACAIPIGLWRDCIDEQIAFFSALSEVNLNCMDQSSYAQALQSLSSQYASSSCNQIERLCPSFSSSMGSSDQSFDMGAGNGFDNEYGNGFGGDSGGGSGGDFGDNSGGDSGGDFGDDFGGDFGGDFGDDFGGGFDGGSDDGF